jgi:hypothetical protein
MGGRNTDEIEVSEMIVLVDNVPKERQDFFLQSVAMVVTHFIFVRTAPLIVGNEIQAFAEEVVLKFQQ